MNYKRTALLLGIFLFALSLRTVYLVEYGRSPHWDLLTLDTHVHDLLARKISQEDFFGHHPFFRSPFYPYLLGIIYAFFGPTLLIPRILHILCGAASCVLVYLIGERLFKPAVGLVAAFLSCIYWVFIYFEGELLLVAVYVFLLLLSLYLMVLSEGRNRKRLAASGLVLGLATITRPNVLVFFPFVLLWLWLVEFKTKRELLQRTLWFFLPPLIILFSITLRNYVLGNDKVLIAYQAGVNFYIGNNENSSGHAAESPYNVTLIPESYKWKHRNNIWINDDVWLSGYYLAEMDEGRDLKPSEFQNYWFKRAFRSIWNNKWNYAKLLCRKVYYFLNAYEIPSNKDPYLFIQESSTLLTFLSFLDFGVIVSFGILGMLVTLGRWKKYILLHAFVVTYSLTNIAFFINTRYRIPVIPVLMLFAVFFGFWLAKRIRARQWMRAVPAVLACTGLLFVSHTEWFGLKDPMLQCVLHYNLGSAFKEKGNNEAAAREYRESIRLNPDGIHVAYEDLCAVYIRAEKYDESVAWADRGIEKFPENKALRLHKGTALLRKGDLDGAVKELEELVVADPGGELASLNLGLAYFDRGEMEKAAQRFEKTLDILAKDPRVHVVARLHLGFIAMRAGDSKKARFHFEKVLALDPRNPEALKLLESLGPGRR